MYEVLNQLVGGGGEAVLGPHLHAKFQHCMFENVGFKPPKSPKFLV